MPATPHRRRNRDLYQPPLPLPTPAPTVASRPGDWRLDEKTRRAGRQGVAAARAALAGAVRPENERQADAA